MIEINVVNLTNFSMSESHVSSLSQPVWMYIYTRKIQWRGFDFKPTGSDSHTLRVWMQVSSVWVFDWSRTVCCDKFTPEIVKPLMLPIWQLISKLRKKKRLWKHFACIHAVMELTTPEPQTLWAEIGLDKNNESDQVKKTKMSKSEMRYKSS